jgi:hypothetical protein
MRCGEAIKSDDDLPIKPEFANATRGGAQPAPLVKPMASYDPEEELRYESGVSRGRFMMVLALILAVCTWFYARTSVATEGRVELSTMQIDEATGLQTPRPEPVLVVRYAVDGKMYEFVDKERDLEPGMTVPVMYRSGDPARGQRGDNVSLYYGAAVFAVIGCGLFVWSWLGQKEIARARGY